MALLTTAQAETNPQWLQVQGHMDVHGKLKAVNKTRHNYTDNPS